MPIHPRVEPPGSFFLSCPLQRGHQAQTHRLVDADGFRGICPQSLLGFSQQPIEFTHLHNIDAGQLVSRGDVSASSVRRSDMLLFVLLKAVIANNNAHIGHFWMARSNKSLISSSSRLTHLSAHSPTSLSRSLNTYAPPFHVCCGCSHNSATHPIQALLQRA
jgi:hypothetical protein